LSLPNSRVRARALLACVLALAALGVSAPARAADFTVLASRSQFVPGQDSNHAPAVMLQGSTLTFRNADPFALSNHTLTSNDLACSTCKPLFDTGDVSFGNSKTLDLSALPAGTYGFHCN